jgi:hypothetical protein
MAGRCTSVMTTTANSHVAKAHSWTNPSCPICDGIAAINITPIEAATAAIARLHLADCAPTRSAHMQQATAAISRKSAVITIASLFSRRWDG